VAQQLPIGSGAIESMCKSLIEEREKGAGMRWTEPGAQAVARLRALHRSGDWTAFWQWHPLRSRAPRARSTSWRGSAAGGRRAGPGCCSWPARALRCSACGARLGHRAPSARRSIASPGALSPVASFQDRARTLCLTKSFTKSSRTPPHFTYHGAAARVNITEGGARDVTTRARDDCQCCSHIATRHVERGEHDARGYRGHAARHRA
jgi:hypothetical protein